MTLYCRACDLGFCEAHVADHTFAEGDEERHALAGEPDVPCAVCSGIYRPAGAESNGAEPAPPELFTAPEKIVSVAQAITSRPTGDPKVAALLGVLTSGLGRRLVLNPALSLLPRLDEPDEWDEWLALLAGCALELVSDGVDLDVNACRENGRQLLASLFAG